MAKKKFKNSEIESKFEETAFALAQERSDFLLPQILDFVSTRKWMNLRPEYQRRSVWDVKKRSLFIESLLLNVPIPNLFLFEHELGRYEVMDGQQRLASVVDFLQGRYALSGLEHWSELNGVKHRELPQVLQRGLERRRLSATVILLDRASQKLSKESEEERKADIRKLVFERLNTGGQKLNAQELRNCIYSGAFNDLLIELASGKRFRKIWGITRSQVRAADAAADGMDSELTINQASKDTLYSRMQDVEIVLRYFAFSDDGSLKGSVRSILDECMRRMRDISSSDSARLRSRFESLLKLAQDIFGEHVFRHSTSTGALKLSRPLFDGVMIALDRNWEDRKSLLARKNKIRKRVSDLMLSKRTYAVVVGRPNTADAIRKRIRLLEKAISA